MRRGTVVINMNRHGKQYGNGVLIMVLNMQREPIKEMVEMTQEYGRREGKLESSLCIPPSGRDLCSDMDPNIGSCYQMM
jgi:hypothetical protein